MFGETFGSLDAGCTADLLVLDYEAPTPVTSENLAWHLVFGMSSASVESVMVNGRFVMRDRRSALDDGLYGEARKASEKLWMKLRGF